MRNSLPFICYMSSQGDSQVYRVLKFGIVTSDKYIILSDREVKVSEEEDNLLFCVPKSQRRREFLEGLIKRFNNE